jgi:hypothetical protein
MVPDEEDSPTGLFPVGWQPVFPVELLAFWAAKLLLFSLHFDNPNAMGNHSAAEGTVENVCLIPR